MNLKKSSVTVICNFFRLTQVKFEIHVVIDWKKYYLMYESEEDRSFIFINKFIESLPGGLMFYPHHPQGASVSECYLMGLRIMGSIG